MADLLTAFGLVFVAELGDKSMLLAIAFTTRYRPLPVLVGIATAAVTMLGLSVLVGAALGAALPERVLAIVGGLVFVGFGVWTLRGGDDGDEVVEARGRYVWLGVMAAFVLAEFGDKTMLATATLASTHAPLPTWLGAGAGMTAASGIAVALASAAGARLPQRAVRLVAAAAFLLFGALLLLSGLRG